MSDEPKISKASLREIISVVSQDTFLFNDSIKNNIRYGKPKATEKEIEKAAKLAGAVGFIKRYEAGYDSKVGERSVQLSGGEQQKISIARALLKDSDIMVFDEPTSQQDKESEEHILNLAVNSLQNKTCIVVSHKVRSFLGINKRYFLKKGKIIEEKPF